MISACLVGYEMCIRGGFDIVCLQYKQAGNGDVYDKNLKGSMRQFDTMCFRCIQAGSGDVYDKHL